MNYESKPIPEDANLPKTPPQPKHRWVYGFLFASLLLNVFFIGWGATQSYMRMRGHWGGPPEFVRNFDKDSNHERTERKDELWQRMESSPEIKVLLTTHGSILRDNMKALRNEWIDFIKTARKMKTEEDRTQLAKELLALQNQSNLTLVELNKLLTDAVNNLPPATIAEIVNRRMVHYHNIFLDDDDD